MSEHWGYFADPYEPSIFDIHINGIGILGLTRNRLLISIESIGMLKLPKWR